MHLNWRSPIISRTIESNLILQTNTNSHIPLSKVFYLSYSPCIRRYIYDTYTLNIPYSQYSPDNISCSFILIIPRIVDICPVSI